MSLLRGAILAALETAGAPGLTDATVGRALAQALKFTASNQSRLLEWLADVEIESGQQREDAASDLAAVLAHRFWYDQRRGWRFTFPNLEQLGLIEVRYNGLAEFCKADEIFSGDLSILRPLPAEIRASAFRFYLMPPGRGLPSALTR